MLKPRAGPVAHGFQIAVTMNEMYLLLSYIFVLLAIALAERLLVRDGSGSRKRLLANYGFGVLTLLVAMALPLQVVGVALIAENWRFGLLNAFSVNAILAGVFSFFVLDAVNYLTHRLLHTRAFWPIHAVHHSDLRLDHSSGLRFHAVELIVHLATASAVVMLFGASPAGVAAYSLVVAVWNLFLHSSLRAPRILEAASGFFLLTPRLHLIHHSQDAHDFDKNFGTVFSFWDRLFGTFRDMRGAADAPVTTGLPNVARTEAEDFHALLMAPFRRSEQARSE